MNILYRTIAFILRHKIHDFDLNNPEIVGTMNYHWYKFKCKKCDKTLSLDMWQMRDLPYSMKIGCKK